MRVVAIYVLRILLLNWTKLVVQQCIGNTLDFCCTFILMSVIFSFILLCIIFLKKKKQYSLLLQSTFSTPILGEFPVKCLLKGSVVDAVKNPVRHICLKNLKGMIYTQIILIISAQVCPENQFKHVRNLTLYGKF